MEPSIPLPTSASITSLTPLTADSNNHDEEMNNKTATTNNNNNTAINSLGKITQNIQKSMTTYVCYCNPYHQVSSNQELSKCQIFVMKYKKIFYSFFALSCGLLSFIILWSEMVLSTSLHSPIGILIGAYSTSTSSEQFQQQHASSSFIQLITLVTLAYMSFCTFWSLFRLNLGWAYTLQPYQSTASALIFNGQYLSRLQFSLGYNFLLTLNAPQLDLTSFKALMSNITLIPVFGTSFIVFVPILMILIAMSTLLNIFPRLLRLLGIETEDMVGEPLCCKKSNNTTNNETNNNNISIEGNLSGEDLQKFESGRMLVKNDLRQMNLVSLMKPNQDGRSISPIHTSPSKTPLGKFSKINATSSSSSSVQIRNKEDDDIFDRYNTTNTNNNIYKNNKSSSLLYGNNNNDDDDDDLNRRIDDDIEDGGFSSNNNNTNNTQINSKKQINTTSSLFSNFTNTLKKPSTDYQPVLGHSSNINTITNNNISNPLHSNNNNLKTGKNSAFLISDDDDDDAFGGGRYT